MSLNSKTALLKELMSARSNSATWCFGDQLSTILTNAILFSLKTIWLTCLISCQKKQVRRLIPTRCLRLPRIWAKLRVKFLMETALVSSVLPICSVRQKNLPRLKSRLRKNLQKMSELKCTKKLKKSKNLVRRRNTHSNSITLKETPFNSTTISVSSTCERHPTSQTLTHQWVHDLVLANKKPTPATEILNKSYPYWSTMDANFPSLISRPRAGSLKSIATSKTFRLTNYA